MEYNCTGWNVGYFIVSGLGYSMSSSALETLRLAQNLLGQAVLYLEMDA